MALTSQTAAIIGLLAACLTTVSFLPQVFRLWRTRRGEDISTSMFLIFSLGTALWLAYGLMIGSLPVAVANAVTLFLSFVILGLKWKWRKRVRPRGP